MNKWWIHFGMIQPVDLYLYTSDWLVIVETQCARQVKINDTPISTVRQLVTVVHERSHDYPQHETYKLRLLRLMEMQLKAPEGARKVEIRFLSKIIPLCVCVCVCVCVSFPASCFLFPLGAAHPPVNKSILFCSFCKYKTIKKLWDRIYRIQYLIYFFALAAKLKWSVFYFEPFLEVSDKLWWLNEASLRPCCVPAVVGGGLGSVHDSSA